MDKEKIYVSGPSITQKEIDYVDDAVRHAWYGNANIFHEKFEKAFANYVGTKYAIALPSCTSAIHLSVMALGIGEGDEAVVPETTWIASSAPLKYVGAVPRFADVDARSWCIDPASAERQITERTKAIITVDLYGNVPDMDAIDSLAEKYHLPIIEDAAEAMGAEYHGRKAGSLGKVGVFSFHGSKTMTTGEGGMLVTNDSDIYERALFLRDHGRKPGDVMFMNREVAYKYKMSSMQAALGLAQLERIEELVARKRQIFRWYEKELQGLDVTLNDEAENTRNTYWMVSIILDWKYGKTGEELRQFLAKDNIDTRPFFHPLSSIPAYRELGEARGMAEQNPVSYAIADYAINLPSGLDMTEEKVERVCNQIREFLS